MKFRPKRFFALALSFNFLFFLSDHLIAGDNNTTYSFLRLDASARSAALGGSFVSITNDPNIIFYNPAGLSTLTSRKASFGFLKHVLDINSGYASFSEHLSSLGWFGAGITFINYGSFTQTDELGNKLGNFNANEIAFILGYSNYLYEKINCGISAKFIYSAIADARSSAYAFDVGTLYIFEPEQITIGASILNIGRQINPYLKTREDLPLDVKIGVSKRLEHLPLLLNLSFNRLNENPGNVFTRFQMFSIGGEFTVSDEVRLRFGYNNQNRKELKIGTSAGLAGFSFGGGLILKDYHVDYALTSLGKVGEMHRITVSVSF